MRGGWGRAGGARGRVLALCAVLAVGAWWVVRQRVGGGTPGPAGLESSSRGVSPAEREGVPSNEEEVVGVRAAVAQLERSPELEGLVVVDGDGQPVDRVVARGFAWGASGRANSRTEPAVVAASDAEGRVQIERSAVLGARDLLVWFVHSEYRARALRLSGSAGAWGERVVLEPARAARVRVVDAEGAPVAGASVHLRGSASAELARWDRAPARPADVGELEDLAAELFSTDLECDAEGIALAPPFPLPLVAEAERGELRSQTELVDSPGPDRTLVLGASFSVSGRVSAEGGEPLDPDARVQFLAMDDQARSVLDWTPLAPSGEFGPSELRPVAGAELVVRFEGAGFQPVERSFPMPAAGERIRAELVTRRGEALTVELVTENGDPIAGGKVSVFWELDESWQRAVAWTDDSGIARVEGCARPSVYVRGEAEGFARNTLEGVAVPSPELVELALPKLCAVRGRCTHRGAAVKDFDLFLAREGTDEVRRERFRDRADGSFEIEDAPAGSLALIASASDLADSEPARVELAPGGTAEVILELGDPALGRGRVVDAATGEGVAGATVRAVVQLGETKLGEKEASASTDAEGRFELRAFPARASRIEASADGYLTSGADAAPDASGALDFGLVPLSGTQTLEVRVDPPSASETLWFQAEGTKPTDYLPIPADGRLTVEGMPPGFYDFYLVWPDGPSLSTERTLVAGRPWEVVFELGDERPLRVELATDELSEVPAELILNVQYEDAAGRSFSRNVLAASSGETRVDHVHADAVTVEVVSRDFTTWLGVAQARFEPGDERLVRVRLSRRVLHVRVVDAEGHPLPGASVFLGSGAGASSWSLTRDTDATGTAHFEGLGDEPVYVHAHEAAHGSRSGLRVELEPAVDTFAEIRLAEEHELRVRVVDGADPVAGVHVQLFPAHCGAFFAERTSNEDGLVVCPKAALGDYTASADQAGIWPASGSIRFEGGDAPIAFPVRRLGGVELVLFRADGSPVSGARVELESLELHETLARWIESRRVAGPSSGLVTDASGAWRIDGIPRGPYLLRAILADGARLELAVEVPPRSVARVELRAP